MKKTAIVTGASRGIGFAIAKQLGLDGFNVALIATSARENHLENLRALSELGIGHLYVRGDIASADDRARIVEEVVAHFGRIDALVNNAGVAPNERADLLDMTEESFDRVVGINTKGTMFFTQAVAKQMISQPWDGPLPWDGPRPWDGLGKRGTIVNVSSCSAVVSSTSRGEYCVSKAGVAMLTTLYADRLAREGILVNEVRPGVIATDMTAAVKDKYDALFASGAFPIARWGRPEDIAGVVSALVSDKFCYTTGNYVDVDGGFHIRRL